MADLSWSAGLGGDVSFPWADWQFYVVSVLMVGGLWQLVRPFVRRADRDPKAGCPGCDTCEDDSEAESGLVQLGAGRPRR